MKVVAQWLFHGSQKFRIECSLYSESQDGWQGAVKVKSDTEPDGEDVGGGGTREGLK